MSRLRVPLGCWNWRLSSQVSVSVAYMKCFNRHRQEANCMVTCSHLSYSYFLQSPIKACAPIGKEVKVILSQILSFLFLGLSFSLISPITFFFPTNMLNFFERKEKNIIQLPYKVYYCIFFQEQLHFNHKKKKSYQNRHFGDFPTKIRKFQVCWWAYLGALWHVLSHSTYHLSTLLNIKLASAYMGLWASPLKWHVSLPIHKACIMVMRQTNKNAKAGLE